MCSIIIRSAPASLDFYLTVESFGQVSVDPESNETLISGMGELHLEIYVERMKLEYGVEVYVG